MSLGKTVFAVVAVAGLGWQPAFGEATEQQGHRPESGEPSPRTLYGLTPFPFDATPASAARTHQLVARHGNLYALHFDDGIPWREALDDRPWPPELARNWQRWKARIPRTQKVYLGLAPLALNRRTLAHPAKSSSLPAGWDVHDLDSPQVMRAFLNYAIRAVEHFEPDFLNLGIEAGNLAFNDPGRWQRFEALYAHVRAGLKRRWPELPLGISITLQHLMRPGVGDRVRDLVEASDYLGLSFYPYGSSAYDRQQGQALAPPPRQWREPLRWVREYTDRPLAIAETGYTTESFDVQAFGLQLVGDPQLQARYLTELGQTAKRDAYRFVVWFLLIDYDKLYEHLDDPDGTLKLWRNIGLWDGNLNPKPAWTVWQRLVGDTE